MLEFDGQPIDPAIVLAQPMKPGQNMDLAQMVCSPGESQHASPFESTSLWGHSSGRCDSACNRLDDSSPHQYTLTRVCPNPTPFLHSLNPRK